MAASNKERNENKNLRALFSIICLSIIALGLIVYFSTQSAKDNSSVGEATSVTVTETTEVANRVEGVTDTTAASTTKKKAESTTKKETTTEAATMQQTDTNIPYRSFYKYPIDDKISAGYTEELIKNETMGDYRAHAAVDFKGSKGAKVVAINDGLVLSVTKDAMLGTVIEIDHGGNLVAQYCGMDVVNVAEGDYVTMGQNIGTLGTVPFEANEEAHLHFITTMNKETVNPLEVMGKTQ